jgi:hypothetical protein
VSGVKAYLVDDVAYGGVRIVMQVEGSIDGSPTRIVYGPGSRKRYTVQGAVQPPEDAVDPLLLGDAEARALLTALQRWYGEDAGDARALRKDYDSERARVDKLVDVLTRIAVGTVS